jgi:predicted amidophosphoribosyltransferase
MSALTQLTDPYLDQYTPVPSVGPGVCDVCHGAPRSGFTRCWSCSEAMHQVSCPVSRVVPISLYETTGQLWTVLRGYKDGRTAGLRTRFTLQVAATLGRFLAGHQRCVAGLGEPPWDLLCTVPSTSGRTGKHPLRQAISLLAPPLGDREAELLAPGPVRVDHNHADDRGFVVRADVWGRRVLLVDDTFTSGARVQSAASALRLAGAAVVAVVVVGRVINPGYNEESKRLWDQARSRRFSFDTCCLEPDTGAEPRLDLGGP